MATEINDLVQPIPEPTIRRLPLYYLYIKEKQGQGNTYISCTDISEDLDLTAIQVRKDLSLTGAVGKSKTGYEIHSLLRILDEFLGYRHTKDALIIGAGNLGLSLLGYDGFKEYGLNIIAAFDSDPSKIGTEIGGKMIIDLSRFRELSRRLGTKIGILAVPSHQAQYVANLMVESGIKAIWNFAPVKINVPSDVIVQHENLASSLAVLSRKLSEKLNKE